MLTFEEISLISDKYKVSVDGFLNPASNESILFNSQNISPASDYKAYLSSIYDHLTLVNRFEKKKMMWENFSSKWKLNGLEKNSKIVSLKNMIPEIDEILNGNQTGRVVLKF